MADLDELYPGRFLKGRTLEAPITIRIVSMVGEELEGEKGVKLKGILRYRTRGEDGVVVEAEMVCNKTNALLAAAVFGTRDYTLWAGHLITIGFDPTVRLGAETPGGIRVMGSPELKAPLRVEIKRPRRSKVEVYMLHPTDAQGRKREQRAQHDQPPQRAQHDQPPHDQPPPADEREPGGEG